MRSSSSTRVNGTKSWSGFILTVGITNPYLKGSVGYVPKSDQTIIPGEAAQTVRPALCRPGTRRRRQIARGIGRAGCDPGTILAMLLSRHAPIPNLAVMRSEHQRLVRA